MVESSVIYAAVLPIHRYSVVIGGETSVGLYDGYWHEPELLGLIMLASFFPYDYEPGTVPEDTDDVVVGLRPHMENLYRKTAEYMGDVIRLEPPAQYAWFRNADFQALPFAELFATRESLLMTVSCRVGAWAEGRHMSARKVNDKVFRIMHPTDAVPSECIENHRLCRQILRTLV